MSQDEDGFWTIEHPTILGCVGQGRTPEEARADLALAEKLCEEVRAERSLANAQ